MTSSIKNLASAEALVEQGLVKQNDQIIYVR